MRPLINLSSWLKPANPVIAFVLPWAFVLLGQQLALCNIIYPKFSTMYYIIAGNILSSFLLFFFTNLTIREERKEIIITKNFEKLTLYTIYFVLTVQFFQFLYFKGCPLIWLLINDGRTYIDYGIKSLNGLINALFLLSTTSLFIISLCSPKKRWKLFALLCALPIVLISRQLIISLFIQISCCLLLLRPKTIKYVIIIFTLVVSLFLILGNYRTGLTQLTRILQPEPYVPEFMYSFLWIYAYLVTPFNNINASIEYIQPIWFPSNELKMVVPSFLHSLFHLEGNSAGFELVHENMNVSTFYLPLVQDFGQFYAFAFMVVVQLALCLAYRKAQNRGHLIDLIHYSVLFMIVFLSFFSNLLLYLPVIFQLIFITIIQFSLRRKRGVLILKKSLTI